MAKFQPIKCTKAQMDAKAKAEGQLFFCTDTGYIYLDTSSTNRMILNSNKANMLVETDTRTKNEEPSYYINNTYGKSIYVEFKTSTTIGLSGGASFTQLITCIPWNDNSGGWPTQIGIWGSNLVKRVATSETTWGPWKTLAFTDSSITGNAATATKATQDSAGQQINTTYIKGLSLSNDKITYTKGNGTTGNLDFSDYAKKSDFNELPHKNSGVTTTVTSMNNFTKNGDSYTAAIASDCSLNIQTSAPITNVSFDVEYDLGDILCGITINGEGVSMDPSGGTHFERFSINIPSTSSFSIDVDNYGIDGWEGNKIIISNIVCSNGSIPHFLSTNVTNENFIPTQDMHPATKKYVDNATAPIATLSNLGDYLFVLNQNGFFANNNAKQNANNSYVLGRIYFKAKKAGTINLTYRCYAESTYDYGIFGQLDQQLSASYTDDGATGSTKVLYSCKGKQKNSYESITYNIETPGYHFFDVKYRKDSSTDSNDDTFEFKLESSDVISEINLKEEAEKAIKAVQDNRGQQIDSTYIKGISISGKNLILTKGDGTTTTIDLSSLTAPAEFGDYTVLQNVGGISVTKVSNTRLKISHSANSTSNPNIRLQFNRGFSAGSLQFTHLSSNLNGPLSGASVYLNDEYIGGFETGTTDSFKNDYNGTTGSTELQITFNYGGSNENLSFYIDLI